VANKFMLQSRIIFRGSKEWHRKSITIDLEKDNGRYKVLCHYEGEPYSLTRVMFDGENRLEAEHHFMTGFHHYLADEYLINGNDKEQKKEALFWFHRAVESLYFRLASSFGLDPMGAWKVNSYFKTEEKDITEIGLILKKFDNEVPDSVDGFLSLEDFKKNSNDFKKGRFKI